MLYDSFDCLRGDAISASGVRIINCHGLRANFSNFFIGKFRPMMSFPMNANGMTLATLCYFIRHVIGECAEKQMFGVHTRRIIATMKNTKLRVKGTVMQFVTNTISFLFTRISSTELQGSVAKNVPSAYPQPASVSFFYSAPKGAVQICLSGFARLHSALIYIYSNIYAMNLMPH